jgi:hypothetical protein
MSHIGPALTELVKRVHVTIESPETDDMMQAEKKTINLARLQPRWVTKGTTS